MEQFEVYHSNKTYQEAVEDRNIRSKALECASLAYRRQSANRTETVEQVLYIAERFENYIRGERRE